MTTLRETVQSVLDRWDSPLSEYAASDLFEELRAALEQPEQGVAMTDREAMKTALEALKKATKHLPVHFDSHFEAITALRAKLEQPDRQSLQAAGTHPAPCARHCEAKAYELEIRGLKSALKQQAEPVAYKAVSKITGAVQYYAALPSYIDPVSWDILPLFDPPQRKPLTGSVLVPLEILEAAEGSLGSFCSDEGWGDVDMRNMDNLSAYIAQHKAAHGIGEKP